MSNLRTIQEIQAAGRALAKTFPPLTDQECAELAFLIAPTAAKPAIPTARAAAEDPAPQLSNAA